MAARSHRQEFLCSDLSVDESFERAEHADLELGHLGQKYRGGGQAQLHGILRGGREAWRETVSGYPGRY